MSVRVMTRMLLPLAVAACWCCGCASFHPQPLSNAALRGRAESVTRAELTVRATVLSPDESRRHFDTPLAKKRIQPVWIEIENRSPDTLWFLPVGVDREYYPTLEAAFRSHRWSAPDTNDRLDDYFRAQTLPMAHPPNSTNAGFVFTQFVRGAKAFNVELLAQGQFLSFGFAQEVPGFKADFNRVHFDRLVDPTEHRTVDASTLRGELECLPATTTSATGHKYGDPLNLVIVGSLDTLLKCLVRSGWHLTEPLGTGSSWRTAKAFFLGTTYQTAPVSHLYAFGRKQDLALQKPRHSIQQRNHLRLWMTPLRFADQPVWLGQVSRDTGVRFTPRSWHLSTHRIAPDVDESRDYLVATLLISQALAKVGWVKGVGEVSAAQPRKNLMGDPYYTDGLRLVLVLSGDPVAAAQVERLPWEVPPRTGMHEALAPTAE